MTTASGDDAKGNRGLPTYPVIILVIDQRWNSNIDLITQQHFIIIIDTYIFFFWITYVVFFFFSCVREISSFP